MSLITASALVGLSLALTLNANAKVAKFTTRYVPSPAPTMMPTPPDFAAMSDEAFSKAQKSIKAANRSVADIDKVDDTTALSDDLKNIRSKLIGGPAWKNNQKDPATTYNAISAPSAINTLIADLDGRYDSLAPDAKFVAAQIIALKPLESAIFRARHLIDNAELTRSAIVTILRAASSGQNAYFPTDQWKAGFDYLTLPSASHKEPDILNEEDFHHYMLTEVRPAIEKLRDRIAALNFTKPIYVDNQMALSTANFVADDDRYAILGETERIATLAGLQLSLSGLYSALAYDWAGLFQATDSVARVYGFRASMQGLIPGLDFVDEATSESRVRIIKNFTRLLTLRPGGEKWTQAAYPLFVDGMRNVKLAWLGIKADQKSNANLNNLIDPRGFLPWNRQIDASLTNIESLIGGQSVSSAVVAGEVVDVKFKDMFTTPPADLKAFLPTGFEGGNIYVKNPYGMEMARNYRRGTPSAWNTSAFKPYFPNVKSNDDIKRTARVMSQAWGGWLLGLPISSLMF